MVYCVNSDSLKVMTVADLLYVYYVVYFRFELFTVVTMKNAIFWDVMPCGCCKNQLFGGTYDLHHQLERIVTLGTTLAVTSKQNMLQRNTIWHGSYKTHIMQQYGILHVVCCLRFIWISETYVSIMRCKERIVRFEVFMAVTMKNGVFRDVTLCGSCKNWRFGGT
jgi:hypothetical protein